MTAKLVLLKSGEDIIADVTEMVVGEDDEENGNVGGAEGVAVVPKGQEDGVIESAEECPGECIMIEPD